MKTLIMSAVAAFAVAASALTVDELNSIPVKSVTADNATAVFDAAVASTNCGRITTLVASGKVSLEDAVHKTMGKTPLRMCKAALDGSTATNYTLIAEAARAIDVTVPMNESEYAVARDIINYRGFIVNNVEVAKPIIADIYAKNKLFGAEFYCSFYNPQLREIFAAEGPVAYEAVKPLIKENATQDKQQSFGTMLSTGHTTTMDLSQYMTRSSLIHFCFGYIQHHAEIQYLSNS